MAQAQPQVELQPYGIRNQVTGRTVLHASGITRRYATLQRAQAAAKRLNAKIVTNDWVGPVLYVAVHIEDWGKI